MASYQTRNLSVLSASRFINRCKGADRVILETKTVDSLARLVEWANKTVLKNFQLRLEMEVP